VGEQYSCEDNSENEEISEDIEQVENDDPDYEKYRYYKKVLEPYGYFITLDSDVELYKDPQEPADNQGGVTFDVTKSEWPCFFSRRYDYEIGVQGNERGITYYKTNRMWSIEHSVVVDTKHADLMVGFEWGYDGRLVALENLPLKNHCQDESDEPDNGDDGENETEPIYDNSHQFQREVGNSPLSIGVLEVSSSVEIYQDPQQNNNSDGLEVETDIDFNEPLYYLGPDRSVSVTYNGYGATVSKSGPDAGLNKGTSIEFYGRHVNAEVTKVFDTGVYPN
jgi:hypothetical protein